MTGCSKSKLPACFSLHLLPDADPGSVRLCRPRFQNQHSLFSPRTAPRLHSWTAVKHQRRFPSKHRATKSARSPCPLQAGLLLSRLGLSPLFSVSAQQVRRQTHPSSWLLHILPNTNMRTLGPPAPPLPNRTEDREIGGSLHPGMMEQASCKPNAVPLLWASPCVYSSET